MNPKYNIYEEIDRYLNYELSEEELLGFQTKLDKDRELQALVEAQTIANEIIIDNEMLKLKERMSKDLNKGNNGLSSNWTKVLLFSIAVGSTAIYSYTQLNTKSENIIISSSNTITNNNINTAVENSTSINNEPKINTINSPAKKTGTVVKEIKLEASKEFIPEARLIQESNVAKETTTEASAMSTVPNKVTLPTIQSEVKEDKIVETKPCETIKITADVNTNYSMNGSDETNIVINKASIKGGTAPYTYALNNDDFKNENRFEGIKDGTYNIRIKDKNNCISVVKKNMVVLIPARAIDEAFTPSHGEHWKFPLNDRTDASITIINKVGTTVYSAQISGSYPSEWDGRGNNGTELDLGNYYFILTFKDQKVVKGNISIIK